MHMESFLMFSTVTGFFVLHHGVQFIMLLGGCLALQLCWLERWATASESLRLSLCVSHLIHTSVCPSQCTRVSTAAMDD